MGNQHNDSMSEQGAWYFIEVNGTQSVRIPSGVTNILVYGLNTANIDRFITRERSGRKLRVAARSDSGTVTITEGNNIKTIGSSVALGPLDSVELICTPDVDGELFFVQTGTTDIT